MPKMTDRPVSDLPEGRRPLWKVSELADHYRVSPWQIYQWVKNDGLPTEPFAGRQKRFDITKVEAWMAANDESDAADEPQLVAAGV